jgi:hypothetical protein
MIHAARELRWEASPRWLPVREAMPFVRARTNLGAHEPRAVAHTCLRALAGAAAWYRPCEGPRPRGDEPRTNAKEIIMSTAKQSRVFVVLKLPLSVPQLIKMAQAIIAALTNNLHIPNPNPPLATLTASLTKLVADEAATKTRAAGTVAARNVSRTSLLSLLHATKANVQQVADLNPDQAEAIITSAGMGIRKATTRTKAPFAAKPGLVSGTVKLVVKAAAARASYEWEWSGDAGKTWTAVQPTLQAKTEILGLPVATVVQFRYRAITKTGAGDWSQPTSILVK